MNVNTVSYTHLDVYKRQAICGAKGAIRSINNSAASPATDPLLSGSSKYSLRALTASMIAEIAVLNWNCLLYTSSFLQVNILLLI